jgi:hypothetical protein
MTSLACEVEPCGRLALLRQSVRRKPSRERTKSTGRHVSEHCSSEMNPIKELQLVEKGLPLGVQLLHPSPLIEGASRFIGAQRTRS